MTTEPQTVGTTTAEEPAKPARAARSAPKAAKGGKEDIIAAIKDMSVLELAELVKALENEFGVSAVPVAAVAAAPAAGVAAPAVEEQTEFTVILKEIGPNKINVIKAVREMTTLGLKEAKDLVEAAPKPVREAVSKTEAQAMKEKLEAAGASVELK